MKMEMQLLEGVSLEGKVRAVDSERTIIEQVRRGDTERYVELVECAQDQVFGVLHRLVRDPDTVEDLAQTAFLKAFENLSSFRQTASFATWVTRIAIHLAHDTHRRLSRAEIVSLEVVGGSDFEAGGLSSPGGDPLEEAIEEDLRQRLAQAIAELPADYREVFVLRHLEDHSYEDIAELTGVSLGALKVRNHRARKLLLDRLHRDENPPALRLHRS